MKKFAFLPLLVLLSIAQLHAQQSKPAKHMVITIINDNSIKIGWFNNMIITRDDTAQVKQVAKLKHDVAANEIIIMQLLQPYYNDGWKLTSTSTEAVTNNVTDIATETFRYYFIKE